jgi:uncharacterized phage protein (TIGR02218 family)
MLTAEIRGFTDRLRRRIGRQVTPTCPWIHARWNGSTYVADVECGLVLTSFIQTGTITSVGDDPTREFSDSAAAEGTGYFDAGLITFTSGPNAGISRDVQRWANQQFTLYRPFPYAVAVGNAYSAVRGDDRTYETCRDVFNNLLNFGGFPHLPGINQVYASPTGL